MNAPLATYAAQRQSDGAAIVWLLIAALVVVTAYCLIEEQIRRNRRDR